jgi:hypothetical protein
MIHVLAVLITRLARQVGIHALGLSGSTHALGKPGSADHLGLMT